MKNQPESVNCLSFISMLAAERSRIEALDPVNM
jgi:hypothetical protein